MMKHFQTKILSIRRISPEAHHVQPLVGAHISAKEKLINYLIKHPKLFSSLSTLCPAGRRNKIINMLIMQ